MEGGGLAMRQTHKGSHELPSFSKIPFLVVNQMHVWWVIAPCRLSLHTSDGKLGGGLRMRLLLSKYCTSGGFMEGGLESPQIFSAPPPGTCLDDTRFHKYPHI